jgi:hypothetical protein
MPGGIGNNCRLLDSNWMGVGSRTGKRTAATGPLAQVKTDGGKDCPALLVVSSDT